VASVGLDAARHGEASTVRSVCTNLKLVVFILSMHIYGTTTDGLIMPVHGTATRAYTQHLYVHQLQSNTVIISEYV
jgi:hypothetical protein